jgi:hypothetical protein
MDFNERDDRPDRAARFPGSRDTIRVYTSRMTRRLALHCLLVLGLLFGLWTAAGHDPDHASASAHPDACAVCAFASGAAGALPATLALLLICAGAILSSRPAAPAAHAAAPSCVRVRGPPVFLA